MHVAFRFLSKLSRVQDFRCILAPVAFNPYRRLAPTPKLSTQTLPNIRQLYKNILLETNKQTVECICMNICANIKLTNFEMLPVFFYSLIQILLKSILKMFYGIGIRLSDTNENSPIAIHQGIQLNVSFQVLHWNGSFQSTVLRTRYLKDPYS